MNGARHLALFLALLVGGRTSGVAWAASPGFPPMTQGEAIHTLVRDLKIEGMEQRVLLILPPRPRAMLVMLPGGAGDVGLAPDGTIAHGLNVLVRTRNAFAERGFALLIPDAPEGRNLRGLRAGALYGRVVVALAAAARAAADAPIFLVGTSQGTIAAMNGAARLTPAEIAGLVLTESVSRKGGSGETVFDADPSGVRVPVLILANTDDACPVAPPSDAARIAASLTGAPRVTVEEVSGGVAVGRACGSRSPHGYWGMDEGVVGRIARWIDAQLAASRP